MASLVAVLGSSLAACSSDSKKVHPPLGEAGAPEAGADAATGVTPAPEGAPYTTLAEWHLFKDPVKQEPMDRLLPYQVNSELFADYAYKRRFVYVPPGEHIGYEKTDKWRFPVGTILVKTFSYLTDPHDPSKGERLLETRLLVHESAGWAPHTYVWDEAQKTATLEGTGDIIPVHFVDPSGQARDSQYVVPTENECRECHGKAPLTNTLGGRTRQLDRAHDYGQGPENQIDYMTSLGLFDTTPDPTGTRERLVDPLGTAPIDLRVRSYFDGNCGHCHQPGNAEGSLSGFWLDYASTDPATNPSSHWGICKQPTSAGGATCGRLLDVVPGAPDESILLCRLEATSPRVRMPPVGRTLVHEEGVAMLREWVSGLPGSCAQHGRDAGTPTADGGSADASTDAATADGAHD